MDDGSNCPLRRSEQRAVEGPRLLSTGGPGTAASIGTRCRSAAGLFGEEPLVESFDDVHAKCLFRDVANGEQAPICLHSSSRGSKAWLQKVPRHARSVDQWRRHLLRPCCRTASGHCELRGRSSTGTCLAVHPRTFRSCEVGPTVMSSGANMVFFRFPRRSQRKPNHPDRPDHCAGALCQIGTPFHEYFETQRLPRDYSGKRGRGTLGCFPDTVRVSVPLD